MARYTIIVNKRKTSLRAVGVGSLVNIWDRINLETSEHAFLGKTDFSDTVEHAGKGLTLTLAKQNTA